MSCWKGSHGAPATFTEPSAPAYFSTFCQALNLWDSTGLDTQGLEEIQAQ